MTRKPAMFEKLAMLVAMVMLEMVATVGMIAAVVITGKIRKLMMFMLFGEFVVIGKLANIKTLVTFWMIGISSSPGSSRS